MSLVLRCKVSLWRLGALEKSRTHFEDWCWGLELKRLEVWVGDATLG